MPVGNPRPPLAAESRVPHVKSNCGETRLFWARSVKTDRRGGSLSGGRAGTSAGGAPPAVPRGGPRRAWRTKGPCASFQHTDDAAPEYCQHLQNWAKLLTRFGPFSAGSAGGPAMPADRLSVPFSPARYAFRSGSKVKSMGREFGFINCAETHAVSPPSICVWPALCQNEAFFFSRTWPRDERRPPAALDGES